MEMHQLRYVVAVARARNFSRAAEQCHVSQPSLSQQIQKLEEELGERLFDRMKREAKLTPHGEAFLPRALKILEEVDVAKREASDAHRLLRGRVIVGVLPTIAPYLLPAVLVDFAKEFPGVEIVVQGNYLDMLKYLTDLESMPWQVFWGKASLAVNEYPTATLTLTIYTLSMDKRWMGI